MTQKGGFLPSQPASGKGRSRMWNGHTWSRLLDQRCEVRVGRRGFLQISGFSGRLWPKAQRIQRSPHFDRAGEGLGPASNKRKNSLPSERTIVELVCAKDPR
jgi:hypothetical protein